MRIFPLVICCVFTLLPGAALTLDRIEKLQSWGIWTSYVVAKVQYPDLSGSLKRACSATTRSQDATLDLVFDSKFLIVRAESAKWNFKNHSARFVLGSADRKIEVGFSNSRFRGKTITFMGEQSRAKQLLGVLLYGFEKGPLTLFDDTMKPIARFSGNGFDKALREARLCGRRQ